MLVRWMKTNQSNSRERNTSNTQNKRKWSEFNCQKQEQCSFIFTFILDDKLFTVSTGNAPNDGKLNKSFCIDGTEAVCECLVVVNDCLVKLFVDRK